MLNRLPSPADIQRVNNGHSVFAPSSSKMHSTCLASVLLNFGVNDIGSVDAAYGTVAHEVGEQWLKSLCEARTQWGKPIEILSDELDGLAPDRIGETVEVPFQVPANHVGPVGSFEITIDEEMMAHVLRYVSWCINLPGDHFVETRVDISRLTPIPDQGGTADHAALDRDNFVLYVTDLKMGIGEPVYPAHDLDDPRSMINGRPNGNTQAMEYALGFIWEYHLEDQPDFEVHIRIAQPRRDYFGVWITTVAELLIFAEWIEGRYALAWQLDAPRTASLDGCRWCKVKASCGSWMVLWNEMTDNIFDPVIEGEFREISSEEVSSAGRDIAVKVAMGTDLKPDHAQLTTFQMEVIKKWRKSFEHFFEAVDTELLRRARDGEQLSLWKHVPGRKGRRKLKKDISAELEFIGVPGDDQYERVEKTPVQLEGYLRRKYGLKKKQAEELLTDVVIRDAGQDTLAPIADERGALDDLGSVFDAIVDTDDL